MAIATLPNLMELNVIIPEKERCFDTRVLEGGYDEFDAEIQRKQFSLKLAAGPRRLVLAHFDKTMKVEMVNSWAKENGYKVALIDHLLAVGSHSEYRNLQLGFPIVALGSSMLSVYKPERVKQYGVLEAHMTLVPVLSGNSLGRKLGTGWYDWEWPNFHRFLLARNEFA